MSSKPHILTIDEIRQAEKHLGTRCPVMRRLVKAHGRCPIPSRDVRPFQTLARSIIGQQLSASAAASIERKVRGVITSFTPEGFLFAPLGDLRAAGLSAAKARYVLELARLTDDGTLDFDDLSHLPDEDVVARLTELPGIGRWTAQMFLIFGLKRSDVLALGDAGLKRSVKQLYGDHVDLGDISAKWSPYCSVASWYLWQHLDAPARRPAATQTRNL